MDTRDTTKDTLQRQYDQALHLFQGRDKPLKMETYTYFSDDIELEFDRFIPDSGKYPGARPGILFFFGGGFTVGCKEAFAPQAEALASAGYAAFCADYRVKATHDTTPRESLADAVNAWRFLLSKCDEWDVDSERLALSGGSAGGALALNAAIESGIMPKCMVLFNPGLWRLNPEAGRDDVLLPNLPPMIIMHGENDQAISKEMVQAFAGRAAEAGLICDLCLYPGMVHGFFNYNSNRAHYYMTLGETFRFLGKYL